MRKCETEDCSNGVMYYHPIENAYYCMNCNTYIYKSGECEMVGSIDESKQLLKLCKSLLEKLREYVKKEKLELRWSIYCDEEKVVQEKLKIIDSELNEVLKDGRLKDIAKIEKKAFSLKDQIISSELFSRYLIHKEMNTLRMNENNTMKQFINLYDFNLNGNKRKEDQMNTIGEYCEELKKVMQSKQNFNNDNIEGLLESWKEKINNKNKQKEDDCTDKENRIIIYEDETKNIQKKGKEIKSKKLKGIKSISYDVFKGIYKEVMHKDKNIDLSTNITFDFSDEKHMKLLKELSEFKLPVIRKYKLDSIPEDSDEVKSFIKNSIQCHNSFYFNVVKKFQIDGRKYIESLKEVAKFTILEFYVDSTNFATKDFCDLISSAKNVEKLFFREDCILLDEECNFGNRMDGCKIEYIDLQNSGSSSYSGWEANIHRFENLIAGISKCTPLKNSLKKLNIKDCGIMIDKAKDILSKYNLSKIELVCF